MKIFDPSFIWKYFKLSIPYIPITLEILFFSLLSAFIIGSLAAVIRIKKIPVLSQLVRVFISYVRGTPVISQLFINYFGLPQILKTFGFSISPDDGIYFVILTYGLNIGAAVAENLKASFDSVNHGQKEAALTIGLTTFEAYRYIIIPQAMIVALPNFANICVAALKNTSLAFSVGIVEMMARAKLLGGSKSHFTEAYLAVAIIYYVFYLLISFGFTYLNKKALRHKGDK